MYCIYYHRYNQQNKRKDLSVYFLFLVFSKPEYAVIQDNPNYIKDPTDCSSSDYPENSKNHMEPILFTSGSTDSINCPSNIKDPDT